MSNYSVLKQDINNNIYENQTQQITGTVLNAILNEMTNALGAGYQFAGVATLGMNPGDPDQRVFYLAGEGVYTNFGGIQVPAGKLGVLKWDNRWTLQTIDGLGGGGANLTGYVSLASTDDLPDEGVATLGYLCGENLYLYVGEGGDTKEGKYQNCGSFRGPQGDSVQDVEQTQTSLENGGVNKIKFTLSNGISCEFQVRNGTTSSGLFPTLAALQAAYPSPVVGQYAFVGAGFPADIYVCTTAGTWTDSGEDYDGDNVDLTNYATKAEVTELEHKVDELDDAVNGIVETETNITSQFSFKDNYCTNANSSSGNYGKQSSIVGDVFKASGYVDISNYAGKTLRMAFVKGNTSGAQYNIGVCFYTTTGQSSVVDGIKFPFRDTEGVEFYELEVAIDPTWKYLRTTYLMDEQTYGSFYCKIVDEQSLGTLQEQIDELEGMIGGVDERVDDLYIKEQGFERAGTSTSAYGWLAYNFLILSGNTIVNDGDIEVNLYETYDVNGVHHSLDAGESILTTYPVRAIRGAGSTGDYSIRVIGTNEKIEDVHEEILESTEVRTPITIISTLSGYRLNPTSKYAGQEETTDVVEYDELPVGTVVRIVATNTNTTPLARAQSIPGFSSSTAYKNISVQSGIPFYYTIEEGYQYLKVCCNTGTNPTVEKVVALTDAVNKMSGAVGRCDSSLGNVAGRATIASLADTEQITLDNYPYNSPKGLAMSFFADITTFGKVLIGKGLNTYRGHWLEIDGTNIVEKFYEGSESTLSTTAHGLTISTYIKVVISTNYAGKCKVSLETLAGHFDVVLDWGYEANGKVFAKSAGSSLTDVVLAATDTDFKLPVWVVGDSYLGIAANRWPGQLKDIGYFNYLINALAGINSTNGLADFKRCLNFGTPKFVIWALGANDYQNIATAISNAQAAQALCEEKGITLLLATVPNMPGRDFTTYNTWVHSQTDCRIVDIAKAVGNPVYESGVNHWYGAGTEYDYLSTDQIHPTRIGAYAMATQVLTDFPEIMQYGLYSDDTTLDDTTTDQ